MKWLDDMEATRYCHCYALKRSIKGQTLTLTMSSFPNWQNYVIVQKRQATGCIPTCYQMLLCAAGVNGIDWTTFQDTFDLEKDGGPPRNHFVSVAQEISKIYPNVVFRCEVFAKGKGSEKVIRINDLFSNGKLVLVSIALSPQGGWHLMPLIEMDGSSMSMVHHADSNGLICITRIQVNEVIRRHDSWPGGEEIAYLEKC